MTTRYPYALLGLLTLIAMYVTRQASTTPQGFTLQRQTKADARDDGCTQTTTLAPAAAATLGNDENKQNNSGNDNNLISLPGEKADHSVFLVSVDSNPWQINASSFDETGFGDVRFQFPKACSDIVKWITQSSPQEKEISVLFAETFRDAVNTSSAAKERQQQQPDGSRLQRQSPRPLFVDVGSNCGFYTMLAASMGMAVHAYDLQPTCTQEVASTVVANGLRDQVRVFFAGVSDGVERLFEYSSFESGCYGAFPARKQNKISPASQVRVPLTSIDERYDEATPISMLKVDTEGNEVKVLQGAMRNFEKRNIAKATVEFTPLFWHDDSQGSKKQAAVDALCKIQGYDYNISWNMHKQKFSDCGAIHTFFEGKWGFPLSRDLLFERSGL